MNPWVTIAAAAVPEVVSLIKAIGALRKSYPSLTPDQITKMVGDVTADADATFTAILAETK